MGKIEIPINITDLDNFKNAIEILKKLFSDERIEEGIRDDYKSKFFNAIESKGE